MASCNFHFEDMSCYSNRDLAEFMYCLQFAIWLQTKVYCLALSKFAIKEATIKSMSNFHTSLINLAATIYYLATKP